MVRQLREGHPMAMTAGIVKQFSDTIDIETTEKPKPGKHQALVKLVSTGVCHTDLHAMEGDWPVQPTPPFIPGHEGVGVDEELGEDTVNFEVGDMAGNDWVWSACGNCEDCRKGWETLCHDQINGDYYTAGSFGEDMLIDTRYASRITETCDEYAVGPVLRAGVTVYKGLKMTETQAGDWVAISGIGGLGHLAVQYAVAMGLRVIAVDIANDKLELAKKHGAEIVINAADTDPAAEVQEQVGGAHG